MARKTVTPKKGLEMAIKAAGSKSALARELGISRVAVGHWEQVPEGRVLDVARVTGIPPHELRHDLYGDEALVPDIIGDDHTELDVARAACVLAIHQAGGFETIARVLDIVPLEVRAWQIIPSVYVDALARMTGMDHNALRPDIFS